MKHVRFASLVAAVAFAALLVSPTCTLADSPPPSASAAVLKQETRWLTAIGKGDLATIESILSAHYKHTTDKGKLVDRAQEIASTKKELFTMSATEETVDLAGDAAVVHGVNTITQSGKVLTRQRFTDVFVKQNGNWMALSAQETTM